MLDLKLFARTALVTGGTHGNGRATALALAKEGAHVLVHSSSSTEAARAVVAEIVAAGGRGSAIAADLSAPDGPHGLAAKVRDLVDGHLDIVFANEGVGLAGAITTTCVDEFDHMLAMNIRAPYFLLQQLVTVLERGASVILNAFPAADIAISDDPARAVTVGAISAMVSHIAYALSDRNIRVNAVAPGIAGADRLLPAAHRNRVTPRSPLPPDLAEAVVFLASEDAYWINGDVLEVS
jgi:NAD(P)-dependent dehydrogenase (short-subunit alcohol dehydrogenase family)